MTTFNRCYGAALRGLQIKVTGYCTWNYVPGLSRAVLFDPGNWACSLENSTENYFRLYVAEWSEGPFTLIYCKALNN